MHYTRLETSGKSAGPVASTVTVPDAFPVASVAVKNLQLGHERVGALKISLTATPAAGESTSAPVTAVLKPVRAGKTGSGLVATSFADDAAAPFPDDAAAAPFTGTMRQQRVLDRYKAGRAPARTMQCATTTLVPPNPSRN